MNNNSVDDHICNICNKKYASYQSLWKHNKEFHKNNDKQIINPQNSSILLKNSSIIPQNISLSLQCLYCNKVYSRSDNLKRHEKTCKIIKENNIIKEKELQLQLAKEQNDIVKNEILLAKLKLKIQSSKKL